MSASIYKITNKVNNKVYIGFTIQNPPEKRWFDHIRRCNKGEQKYLYSAMRKYGVDNFTFDVICQSLDENYCKNVLENYFITKHNSHKSEYGYNLTTGGDGTLGFSLTGSASPNFGRKHSEEFKKNKSKSMIGHFVSESTRQKIGMKHRGKIMSIESRIKMSQSRKGRIAWNKGSHLSDEHKRKLSISHLGHSQTQETCNKIKNSMLGEKNPFFGKKHSEETKQKMRNSHKLRKKSIINQKLLGDSPGDIQDCIYKH